MLRTKSPLQSFRHALNGLLLSYKTQRHLRFHFGLAVLALIAGLLWRLPRVELLILIGAISLVILCELFNTALEAVVDLVTAEYHPLAKVAKDVAAAAVLVAAINAVLIGMILFLDIDQLRQRLFEPRPADSVIETFAVGIVLLFLLLVTWKVRGGKGRFLEGGVVSGHTAIAFFLCTVILLVVSHPLVSVPAVLLALLVAQSRVSAGIHSLREVLYGAALGTLIPMVLHRMIPMLVHQVAGRYGTGG